MSASTSIGSASSEPANEGAAENLLRRLRRLEQRSARERTAREEAERLLESKSLELFEINQNLLQLNNDLEARVAARTAALSKSRRAAQALVETDHLTKLSSRYHFHKQLIGSLEAAAAIDGPMGLLLIDIDGFKAINDAFGHASGDELLVQVAARLSVAARRCDFVSRLGGDELAIILVDSGKEEAGAIAERILGSFQPAFTVHGVTMKCTASIGIACFPEHAASGEELQRSADLALYKAKLSGRNQTAAYTPQLLEDHQLRHRREAELRECITSAEIDVWYQPIVDLRTGRNRAVEALARMKGGNGQYLPADVFIPLAEEIGLIRDLGRQVLRVSLKQSQGWFEAGLIDKVAVNVSAGEFLAEEFADDVLNALACVNMSGERLMLEITESVMMARLDVVREVMSRLSERGVSFALDDFGCGYTNLAYLRQLSVHKVKLDLSLLTDVAIDRKAQAIVRHVVSLCKELGSVTVCEGIETIEQLEFVQSIGCDLGQGYLLGRPLSADEAGENLRAGRNRLIGP
jgi:diguanylate cyclase (GGDEF)-like protein